MQHNIFFDLIVTRFLPHISQTEGSEITQLSSKRKKEVYNTIKSDFKKVKIAIIAAKIC